MTGHSASKANLKDPPPEDLEESPGKESTYVCSRGNNHDDDDSTSHTTRSNSHRSRQPNHRPRYNSSANRHRSRRSYSSTRHWNDSERHRGYNQSHSYKDNNSSGYEYQQSFYEDRGRGMEHRSGRSNYDECINKPGSPRHRGHSADRYHDIPISSNDHRDRGRDSTPIGRSSSDRVYNPNHKQDDRFTIHLNPFTELQTLMNNQNEEYVILKRWRRRKDTSCSNEDQHHVEDTHCSMIQNEPHTP